MWTIDLYHDFAWTNELQQEVSPKLSINLRFFDPVDLEAKLMIYGTEYEFKYARIELDLNSKEEVEYFQSKNLHKIINSIELALSISYQEPFHFNKIRGTNHTIISYGKIKDDTHIPLRIEESKALSPLDYSSIEQLITSRFPGFEDLELFFIRGLDTTLDPDYRWINSYKLLEKYFSAGKKAKLINNDVWIKFLESFRGELDIFLSTNQSLQGLMEELRASAAHSIEGLDPRVANARLESTLPIIIKMAKKVINEHPNNSGKIIFT